MSILAFRLNTTPLWFTFLNRGLVYDIILKVSLLNHSLPIFSTLIPLQVAFTELVGTLSCFPCLHHIYFHICLQLYRLESTCIFNIFLTFFGLKRCILGSFVFRINLSIANPHKELRKTLCLKYIASFIHKLCPYAARLSC